jgi:hypothetical protein
MTRSTFAFSLLAVTALAVAACGDDDGGGDEGNDGKGGNNGTGGSPPVDNVSCDPDAATTCQNEMDCPFVADGSVRVAAQTCGGGECLASEDEDCARDCILAELDISAGCAGCYADFVNCTIAQCLAPCIAGADSEGCLDCQETSGCRPDFDDCSGLEE